MRCYALRARYNGKCAFPLIKCDAAESQRHSRMKLKQKPYNFYYEIALCINIAHKKNIGQNLKNKACDNASATFCENLLEHIHCLYCEIGQCVVSS